MAIGDSKGRLVAIVGLVAGICGGLITAGANHFFEIQSRKLAELSAQRTDSYMAYIKLVAEDGNTAGHITRLAGKQTPIRETCWMVLTENEPLDWPAAQKERVRILCDKLYDVKDRLTVAVDRLPIYASKNVIEALAEYERADYAKNQINAKSTDKEKQDAHKRVRDSYVELLISMRCDDEARNKCHVDKDDVLAIICKKSSECFGYVDVDDSYMKPVD